MVVWNVHTVSFVLLSVGKLTHDATATDRFCQSYYRLGWDHQNNFWITAAELVTGWMAFVSNTKQYRQGKQVNTETTEM